MQHYIHLLIYDLYACATSGSVLHDAEFPFYKYIIEFTFTINGLVRPACLIRLTIGRFGPQKRELRQLINIDKSSQQPHNFFIASTELIQVMARLVGTWKAR